MAQIRVFQGGDIQPDAPTVTPFRAPDFGPGIGPGIEKLGQAVGQTADVVDQVGQLHDEASVKEQVNGISQWYAEAGYTGPNALFPKKGKDALDTAPLVTKGLDEEIKQRRSLLQNDRQRFIFDQAMGPQRIEWDRQIGTHAANETLTYATDESAARAGMAGQLAGLSYADNPTEGEAHISTMNAEIAKAGKIQGLGPDAIAEKQFKATSGVYQDVGVGLVKEGPQGPDLARRFVELHKGSLSDDARQMILDHADAEQRTLMAEQRRLDADQHRQDRENQQDSRARVETGLARLDDTHTPLSADDYASLLSDAQTTKDVNLVKRVKDAQFKNGLAVQWNGVPPGDIQNRVNNLSASITKAGNNADPQMVEERDYLQGLYNSSKSQLDSNGLAWGAKNLGVAVEPLNLGIPGSIATRVSQVNQISQRAGHPIGPLQPEEVAQYAPQWKTGTVQQKVALATQVAQFGSLAGDAAQQIAPNDNGFANLIGIASHGNPSVAASRVNQIVTGYEALKTMPKLVNRDQSLVQFNLYVGQSLQFLPGVKDGVYTNAKALLASEANDAGVSDWGSLDGRAWYKAVNSALGSYTKNGQQYGGIAAFNGAPTILPENMTQEDFEDRISRAHGSQFRAAQNGAPMYANGKSPTATDIKKMQWVPSDDGVYRLSDGHSFLHNDKGGFYEIDVRKLPSFNQQLAAVGYVRR